MSGGAGLRWSPLATTITAPKNYALIPVVQMTVVVTMMIVGVIGVVVRVVVAIVMMVVTMMITVPSCGWSRAADCDYADNS
jgi:hypothetical protein